MRKNRYFIVFVLLLQTLTACNNLSFNKTLSLKAAIVYNYGGAQPIARTTFYLSKKDLEVVIKEAKISVGVDAASQWGVSAQYQAQTGTNTTSNFIKAIQANAISSVTTDFDGAAKFENIPSGTYYIIGIAQTRSGMDVWNLRINTNETQTIFLDQSNTSYKS